MYQTSPLIVFTGDSQAAIAQIMESLTSVGLQVLRSFDLQVARVAHTNCTCPHHGTDQCNCQLVVLLVYEQDKLPVTLIAHGHDGETQLAFVDHPNQRPDPVTVATIRSTLSLIKPSSTNFRLKSHAT